MSSQTGARQKGCKEGWAVVSGCCSEAQQDSEDG